MWGAKIDLPDKLNICLIAIRFPILGRAADHGFLWPIARALAKRGHQVTVLAWKNPQGKTLIQQDGVTAYFLSQGSSLSLRQFPELVLGKFLELHQDKPFHMVHSIDGSGYLVGLRRRELKIAMAYDVDATQMSQLFSILGMSQENLSSLLRTTVALAYKFLTTFYSRDRKLLRTADAIFVTSPKQRIILERYYLYPDYKTHTIPYGIEIGDLSPREKSDELRQKIGLPPDAQTVVTITDMTELGEVKNLLIAFEKVAVKKPSARLIIVGNGPLRFAIEREVLNLVLGSRVIFTGTVTNQQLPDHIAMADIFVNLSSRTTGLEPSILEAMAQKKVIIGSEVSAIATIVEDDKDGYLIRPADTATLSALMLKIFSSPDLAQTIGEAARKKVVDLFDTDKMVDQTLLAYHQTLIRQAGYRRSQKQIRDNSMQNLFARPGT